MKVGDRVELKHDISGTVIAVDDATFTVRWDDGSEDGTEATYTLDTSWEEWEL